MYSPERSSYMYFPPLFIVLNINLHGDKPLQTVLFFLTLNPDLLVFSVAVLRPPLDADHLVVMVLMVLEILLSMWPDSFHMKSC
jgi:hypothetical protein